MFYLFIDQTGLPVGFYLRKKKVLDKLWARCAVVGADLAVLAARGWVGHGISPCWARWVGRGFGLSVSWIERRKKSQKSKVVLSVI